MFGHNEKHYATGLVRPIDAEVRIYKLTPSSPDIKGLPGKQIPTYIRPTLSSELSSFPTLPRYPLHRHACLYSPRLRSRTRCRRPPPASKCSPQCCKTVQKATNPTTSLLLGLLGVVISDLNVLVGLSCTFSPVHILCLTLTSTCRH